MRTSYSSLKKLLSAAETITEIYNWSKRREQLAAPTDAFTMQPPNMRFKKNDGRGMRKCVRARRPGCLLLDSVFKIFYRDAATMKSQQYGCRSKTSIMTVSVDKLM